MPVSHHSYSCPTPKHAARVLFGASIAATEFCALVCRRCGCPIAAQEKLALGALSSENGPVGFAEPKSNCDVVGLRNVPTNALDGVDVHAERRGRKHDGTLLSFVLFN
jgi:hypothetical protein